MQEQPETKKRLDREGLRKLFGIYRYVFPYKKDLAISLVTLFITTALFFTFPVMLQLIIKVANGRPIEQPDFLAGTAVGTFWASFTASLSVNRIGLFMGVVLLCMSVISYIRTLVTTRISEYALADLRTDLFRKIISLEIPFFEKNRSGELGSRITNDVTQLQEVMSWTLIEMLRQVLLLGGGIVFLILSNHELALLMLAAFPPTILVAFYFGRKIKGMSKSTQNSLSEANIVSEESLQNIQVVKSFTGEQYETQRYSKKIYDTVANAMRVARYRAGLVSFVVAGIFGGIILVIWYASVQILNHKLDDAGLFGFIFFTGIIGGAVATLGDSYGRLQKAVGASERLLEILHEKSELQVDDRSLQEAVRGEIEFKDVSFYYPTRKDVRVLNKISFHIKEGSKTALVGHSGCGKSTIAKLLMHFYPQWEGDILIDGKPLQDFSIFSLRHQIGLVPQEVMLFGGTIAENIMYGSDQAGIEEITAAAKKAYAWDFISQFPEGLNTIVGDRGVKLSGGQKQRIAIARTILKNPKILILDEATSALDSNSEQEVQRALEELMKNRTTLIIAHRLSTIRQVDQILVLDHGNIIEKGTHEELTAYSEGSYARMIAMQNMQVGAN